ncbi:hypothetical protein CR513_25529, partial [Mucuna pruriens]
MTVLGLARASSNSTVVQVEPNNKSLICSLECDLFCAPLAEIPLVYPICLTACNAKCSQKTVNPVHDCITSCGFTKSTQINNDVRGLAADVVDSCLKECQNKS